MLGIRHVVVLMRDAAARNTLQSTTAPGQPHLGGLAMSAVLSAFVSSDMDELPDDRYVAASALKGLSFDVYQFEEPSRAAPTSPEQDWQSALRRSHVYVMLVGCEFSQATFDEFQLAQALQLPVFIYRKAPRQAREVDPRVTQALKAANIRWGVYKDVEQLRKQVSEDIRDWMHGTLAGMRESADLRNALREQSSLEVFTQSLEDRVAFEIRLKEQLLRGITDEAARPVMSSLPLPAFVTRPWDYQLERQRIMYRGHPGVRREIVQNLRARYDAWERLARCTQVRWLLDRPSHERYFAEAGRTEGYPSIEQANLQLARTIELVHEYPNLAIALQDQPIPTTFTVIGRDSVTVFGDINAPRNDVSTRGIRGLISADPPTVLRLRLAFEADWARATPRPQSKEWIVAWLRSLMR